MDPLYDKDILEWIASFKPIDRNAALLMVIRSGINAEEVSINADGLESQLEAIQNNMQGLRDEFAKLRRDVKNAQMNVNDNKPEAKIIGEQIDLDDVPEAMSALNKLVKEGR